MFDILKDPDEGPDESDLTPEEGLKRRVAKDEDGEGEKRKGEEDRKPDPPELFVRWSLKCAYLFLAEVAAGAGSADFLAVAAAEDSSKRNKIRLCH